MKEEWTDKLRRKLDGHKMTPPAGLWEGISKEMGFEAEPVSKPAVMKRWYWAAAVLALVGFFVFYKSHDIEHPHLANAVSQQPVSETLASEQSASQQPESESPKKSEGQVRNSGIAMNQATCPPDFVDEPEQVPPAEEKDEPRENVQTEHEELRAEQTAAHTNSELKGMQGNHNSPLSTFHSPPTPRHLLSFRRP